MLTAVEERIVLRVQEHQETIQISAVQRNTQDVDKTSVVVDMESPWCVGRVTCWDSGECDLEVIHNDTGERISYTHCVVATPMDLDPHLTAYLQALHSADPPPAGRTL